MTQTATPVTVADTTPPGTQAAILDAVIAAKHPRLALPSIASNYGLALAQLQTIVSRAGYPDTARMAAAARRLREEANASIAEPSVEPEGRVNAQLAADQDRRLARVPVADLHPDPGNLRENVSAPSPDGAESMPIDDVEQLAESIREVGLLQPIIARRDDAGRLFVVAGHRRLAAIKRLRWTHVDVVIRPPMRPDHVIAAMLIENGQRRDLDPIEEARGIRKLKAVDNASDAEIARRIGRSQGYVSTRLALLNLSPEEQEQVRNGQMGRSEASNLGRLKAGKVHKSSKGHVTVQHFGPTHSIATRAKARCDRLHHKGRLAGGMACGPCWESVIRADERDQLQAFNATADDCVTCGTPLEKGADRG